MEFPPNYAIDTRIASFTLPKSTLAKSSRGKKQAATKGGWPHTKAFRANPESLASAGFFYLGSSDPNEVSDEVECFMCGHTLDGWDPDDDPHREHAKRIKQTKCAWAIAVCSIRNDKPGLDSPEWEFRTSDRLPTAHALEKARRATFGSHWPHDQNGSKGHGVTSKKMAEAGFVYTPTADAPDMVTCPYCEAAFDEWDITDNPIMLHQKKRPTCPMFTGRLHVELEEGEEEETDDGGPVAPLPISRKGSSTKHSSRKPSSTLGQSQRVVSASKQRSVEPSSGPSSMKSKRLTKATPNPSPQPIEEASEPELGEEEPAPSPPPKKSSRQRSIAQNPLSKSTRTKKPQKLPPVDATDVNEVISDFDATPAMVPRVVSQTRSRSQSQVLVQAQTLSRNPSRPRPDAPTTGSHPSRSQSSRVVSGKSADYPTAVQNGEESEPAVAGVKVSRKKKPVVRPPTSEEEGLKEPALEPEPEPAPFQAKKSKSETPKTKSKPKKTETLTMETPDNLLLPPTVAPTSVDAASSRSRRKTARKKNRPVDAETDEVDEMAIVTVPKVKKVAPPVLRVDVVDFRDAAPAQESASNSKKGAKGGSKPSAKGKKAVAKPIPEPVVEVVEEQDAMDIDSISAATQEQDSVSGLDHYRIPHDVSDSASRSGMETELDAQPSEEDDGQPNLPGLGSPAIAAAAGASIPKSNGTEKHASRNPHPQQKLQSPRMPLVEAAVPNISSHWQDASTLKAHPATPQRQRQRQQPTTPTSACSHRSLRAMPPSVIGITAESVLTFTEEEKNMTLEEYVVSKMNDEFEKLKADGERLLAEFDERAREVRRQIEEM